MNNDAWGRTVTLVSDDGIEAIYSVGVDSNGNPGFTLAFVSGDDLTNVVYPGINGRAPLYSGGTGQLPAAYPNPSFIGSGHTVDRPATGDGAIPSQGMLAGMTYFDNDLMQMITFVGFGSTGWVNGAGTQV
jgi:hypothetical protein